MKRAVVMGLGASGVAAAKLLVEQGWSVTGVDLREHLPPIPGVVMELGPHRRQTFLSADRIVVSPGVPSEQPDILAAEEAGVPVWSELALAVDHLGAVPMVGITGTNGKSTVTHFTGQLLSRVGPTFVGGNLGVPLSEAALSGGYEVYVLELSSYQLERPGALHPHIGVVLNLTPDHLQRHGTMERYAAAKAQLFNNLGPTDVRLCTNDPLVQRAVEGKPGVACWWGEQVRREGKQGWIQLPGVDVQIDLSGFQVPGEHNLDNAVVACALALFMGAPLESVQAGVAELTALEHRMQLVPTEDGRVWIDDSKSTNVASTLAALKGRTTPTVLLLGGQAKGPGFVELVGDLAAVERIVCFGASGLAIHHELSLAGVESVRVQGLADAVSAARTFSREGMEILLSPGCASFDEFDDFNHRGRVFTRLVRGES